MPRTTNENQLAKRAIFLSRLAETGRPTQSAIETGWDRVQAYRVRRDDPEFAEQWDAALEAHADKLEAEAYRRAVEGLDEPLSHQGQLSYEFQRNPDGSVKKDEDGRPMVELDDRGRPKPVTVKKYSDSLLALMLKAKRKREYGDSSKVELSGADGGPVKVEESPTAIGRKIAFALAVAMRAKGAAPPEALEATGEAPDATGEDMA